MKNCQCKSYRIAPSPTGYVHIGTIGMAIVNSYLAKQNNADFNLRIEDTDNKRLVEDAKDKMLETFEYFGLKFDNTFIQTERLDIYKQYVNKLLDEGKAYYCFCTEEELTKTRETQLANKEKTGYYGKYAKCKNLTKEETQKKIASGVKYVVRANFSYKDWGDRITFVDGAKGEISLPPEINDPIILKANGIPPYNFAHAVDDTLMGTEHIVRGEEWLISTAEHMQLCDLLGFERFNYIHMPTINIEDQGKKRKLSKRKDKMALVMNLINDETMGYPKEAIIEYLLTIYNTDFELWRIANPDADVKDFIFRIEKIGSNNPLLDIPKLNDISKNILAKMTHKEIVSSFNNWVWEKIPNMNKETKNRIEQMLNVERGGERPRKDLTKFGDIANLYSYLFDNFTVDKSDLNKDILARYAEIYNEKDTKEEWWDKIKSMTQDKKELRTIAHNIRFATTGKENTPDLWSILRILGEDKVKERLMR